MEAHKVDMFIISNAKYFEPHQIPSLREILTDMEDSKFIPLQSMNFNDPFIMLIVSFVAGHFGVDRLLIGDIGLGIAKLLTCGGLGIWTLVDWFLIMGRTRQRNMYTFTNATI